MFRASVFLQIDALFFNMDKKNIIDASYSILNLKIDQIKQAIEDSNSSLREDTKSSAGDKYETSREMIQQDLNRYENQLQILKVDLELLDRIAIQKEKFQVAAVGSIIKTDKAVYFIATSIGQIQVDNQLIFSISSASPIGKLLIGKKAGDILEFNGNKQIIHSVD